MLLVHENIYLVSSLSLKCRPTFQLQKISIEYLIRRIYMLSFVVSSMLFGCAIVAVLMVLFLYCLHNQLARTFIATKITSARLPPPSNYVIDIGLANVLLALYIGINEDMVGTDVMLHDLALWVGVLTMCMVMLDTIMTLALYIALSDGKLQLGEYTFLQIMHFFRYLLKDFLKLFC